jgi:hemerythrin-like domain-containing protein
MSDSGPSSQPSTTVLDTSVMPTLHTFHRREFRLAGGVVRDVAAGDLRRAEVVADHVDYLTRHLHDHHTTEDELMWPKLLERVPEDQAPIVHLMESQHERLDGLIQQVTGLLPAFRETADVEVRDRLADLLDNLHVQLVEHLDAEEQRLLPIAARTMTQEEWDAMGDAGRSGLPRKEMALTFGMYQYEGEPAVLAGMLAEAPPPVRWIVPLLSRRAFRNYAQKVHGTPTP